MQIFLWLFTMLKYLQIKKKIILKFFVISISFIWDGGHFYPTTTPNKRSLKIPKGQSESIYRRRTDNTMAKRYQSGNQNPSIEEEQTTQWPKDTKAVIRIVYWRRTDKTMAKRYQRSNQNPYIEEEQTTQLPKDTKRVIRIHISKKNKQQNGQNIPKE